MIAMNQNQWKSIVLWFLLFVAVLGVNGQEGACDSLEWQCKDGKCIASDELCDGAKDCQDGSDEIAESCVHVKCPKFSFRCAYGACVNGKAECNKVQECADNSDETTINCPGVSESFKINGNCSEEFLQCQSGECTPIENACDGKPDCADASDETVKLCATAFCPAFAFRCGYGACVNGDATCDGFKDCADGSDESPTLCGLGHTTQTPINVDILPVPTPVNDIYGPPRGCLIEDLPNVIVTYESNKNQYLRPGQVVSDFSTIVYKCRPRHVLDGAKSNICLGGKWTAPHPTCSKYCSSIIITGVTFKAACEFGGTHIPCNEILRPGTRATISCQIGYRKPENVLHEVLVCEEFGEWDHLPFRCEQVCGREPIDAAPFQNGDRTNNTLEPWNVGIYAMQLGRYEQICGGTIINARIVLSAAHCFWDNKNERHYDISIFAVAAGKYYRDYYAVEPLPPQFFNLSELHIPSGYHGVFQDYIDDIAVLVLENFLEFKSYIQPICIEWQSYSDKVVKSNLIGRVAGWGKLITNQPSEELRVVHLPTVSKNQCYDETEVEYRSLVTSDKFCVRPDNGESVCEGDSGGGFAIPQIRGGLKIYFLWGIVSNGLNTKKKCDANYLTTLTNIQYHDAMIIELETRYRPK